MSDSHVAMSSTKTNYENYSSLARIILVILLRVGFVLIQVGSVPVNNVNLILLQNIADVCWATAVYILIGFVVAFNGDVAGLIGEGYWIGDAKVDKDEAIIGWTAVVIASAICTCGIVGRTHTVGYLLIGFLLAALVQPLLVHWAWTRKGWMQKNALTEKGDGYRDYAGCGIVHLVGGLSGLIGCMTLGRRILRLRDIDDASIAAGSSGTVFAGQLLVFVGLQSLSMPNSDKARETITSKDLSGVYTNNLVAGSSSGLLVVALHFILGREAFNHWTVMRCVQAMVSGLVVVSAGTEVYTPQAAIGLGCAGGVVFFLVSRQVFRSALEDYCNVAAIHFVCAVLGSLLAPLCTPTVRDGTSMKLDFSWQLICLLALFLLVAVVMTIAFLALKVLGILRNRSEYLNHLRANVAVDRGPRKSCLQRLFFPDAGPLYLEPGSISNPAQVPRHGSRFWNYQREIEDIERSRSIEMNRAGASENSKGREAKFQDTKV